MIFVKTFLQHLSYMSDVSFKRVLFYYAEWQETYRELQCDTRIDSTTEYTVTKKTKNIIEFREELLRAENYSSDLHCPKLVIINDLMNRHRAK